AGRWGGGAPPRGWGCFFAHRGGPAALGGGGGGGGGAPPLHDLAEAEEGGLVFPQRDRYVRLPRHLGEAHVVLGRPHRLLEPEETIRGEGPSHGERLRGRPGAVDVEHELHVGAHRLSRGADGLDVGLV